MTSLKVKLQIYMPQAFQNIFLYSLLIELYFINVMPIFYFFFSYSIYYILLSVYLDCMCLLLWCLWLLVLTVYIFI